MTTALQTALAVAGSSDSLAWGLCIVGGVLGGSYPVFIKVPRVINAKVSPIIFQCYKSLWVFLLAWIFLLINLARGKALLTFTYWGIAGASLWVPAGFAYISAVSLCGVATTAVLNSGVSSMIQFVVSVCTTQTMVRYGAAGIPAAPFYLVGLILGMMGLILAPNVQLPCLQRPAAKAVEVSFASTVSTFGCDADSLIEVQKPVSSQRDFVTGVLLATLSGTFGGMKYAITSIGHSFERAHKPAEVAEAELNVFESYMMSFGIGCALSTTAFFLLFAVLQKGIRKQELPSPQFGVMKLYGFLAGSIWFCHYMCTQGANNVGGGGTFGPASSATMLITAGLWGLLYYREVRDPRRIMCWAFSAAWTICFVVLLAGSLEKTPEEEQWLLDM